MSDSIVTGIVGILTAVIGVAIIAVLVSNQANTGNVIKAGAGGFAQILQAATAPVSGNGFGGLGTSAINTVF
jgi:hypothetical protein